MIEHSIPPTHEQVKQADDHCLDQVACHITLATEWLHQLGDGATDCDDTRQSLTTSLRDAAMYTRRLKREMYPRTLAAVDYQRDILKAAIVAAVRQLRRVELSPCTGAQVGEAYDAMYCALEALDTYDATADAYSDAEAQNAPKPEDDTFRDWDEVHDAR